MKEPSLVQVQQWMKSRIQPSDDAGSSEAFAVALNPQGGSPGEERISVYAEGYEARFHEALAEVYEAVRFVVGKDHFLELAHRYAQKHPSRDTNLSFVGRHLPEFLRDHPLTRELPFLPALAELEWRVCLAFHAFHEPPVDVSDLSKLSAEEWARASFIFQPSVALVKSQWPILDIWNARKQSKEEVDIDLNGRPQEILVFRQGLRAECRPLADLQSCMLQKLLEGATLEAVCEALAEDLSDDPDQTTEWFSGLVRDQLISRIQFA